MKTRTYQIAVGGAVTLCILLAAALAYVALPRYRATTGAASQDPVVARGTAVAQHAGSGVSPAEEPELAPLHLSAQRLQQIGVTTTTAEMRSLNDELNAPGNVDIDEQGLSYVQTRFSGWIQEVYANATYQYVRKGQPLFTIYSPELVSSQQEYLLAKQNQKAFSGDPHGLATQEGGWLLQASEERLRQFGVPAKEIGELEQSGKVKRNIAVDSPVSGYITERNALPNAYVQPDTKLYTIADLSTVWVYANVFQSDVGRLKPGNAAQVTVDSYPGRSFNGRVDQILPQVDMATRTVRVRLVFRNPGLALKPGMYVNVKLQAPLGRQLVVPSTAVLQSGSRAIAFIDHGQGNLEPRTIETGPQIGEYTVVLRGLKAGERVVGSANFLVDSEAQLQAAMGSFTPLPQQHSTEGNAQALPEDKIQIRLSTKPDPPRRGSNTMHVALTGADGKPVSGVQVTVTFYMPAMPAMGMAAMHTTAKLTDKSSGHFEGPVELGSGGTWQVTVTVQRDGHVIATKQTSMDATGGM